MNEKLEKVKIALAAAAAGMVVGIVITIIIYNRRGGEYIIMPRFWSSGDNNFMRVFINPLGDPGNVVQCVETGTIYASQGQAARALGVTAAEVSNHVCGKVSHVNGQHFVILGKAGEVLAENTEALMKAN